MPRVPHSTDDLAEAELAFQRALLYGDAAALAVLLDDEITIVRPGGHTSTKDEELAAFSTGELRIGSLEVERSRVRVLEELGLSFVTLVISGTRAGVPFTGRERHTRTWRLADEWIVVASHATSVRD